MSASVDLVANQAAALAADLSPHVLSHIADAIGESATLDWPQRRLYLLEKLPQARHRSRLASFLDLWQTSESYSPGEVAMALRVAAVTAERLRSEQSVELVWTGPETPSIPLRRTEQVLLQVIQAARHNLLVVSFAVYRIETIIAALVAALARGVRLRICVEAPEPSGYRMAHDTMAALGRDVGARAEFYIWPAENRALDAGGKQGSLHAKCAVADANHLLISSANLTGHAMRLNMELGVLVHGGKLPVRVNDHFQALIAEGVLQRVAP